MLTVPWAGFIRHSPPIEGSCSVGGQIVQAVALGAERRRPIEVGREAIVGLGPEPPAFGVQPQAGPGHLKQRFRAGGALGADTALAVPVGPGNTLVWER